MKYYKIALLPGDGIGPEVLNSTLQVLKRAQEVCGGISLEFREYPIGRKAFAEQGDTLPPDTLQGIRAADAALIGAISTEGIPSPSPIGRLRKELNLFADVRPIKAYPGVWSHRPDLDIVFIRENTEGFLADRNLFKGDGEFMPTADTVMSLRLLTRQGCERIARFAFAYARSNKRKTITVVHKKNVLKTSCGFFLNVVREVAQEFPEIVLRDEYVDSVANNLITAPEKYDVILATNLFGDIISDEGAALVSNLVPTANIGEKTAVFLPVNHEARYEESGKDLVNPLPSILCGAMMLSHLGAVRASVAIELAVKRVLVEGVYRTADLGGVTPTSKMTEKVCRMITLQGC